MGRRDVLSGWMLTPQAPGQAKTMKWELGLDDDPGATVLEVPGYEILEDAGRGATGRVYVARQINLGRKVALKHLSVDPESDPVERLARFRREAGIMAGLSHPNVLSIFDYGEADGRPFLVMEYIEGGDLRRLLPIGTPLPVARILTILVPIAEALDYLHRRGILHRDLKPENILMSDPDTPKVADFGIAVERSGSGELTRSGQGLGTLGYVAPEQQYRLNVDERADQYSLAAMTYEMLTGNRPLGVFKPPSKHNPSLPPRIDEVVLKGLQEDPHDRYSSVMEFSHAVCAALGVSDKSSGSIPSWVWWGLGSLVLAAAIWRGSHMEGPPPHFGGPGGPPPPVWPPPHPPGIPPQLAPNPLERPDADKGPPQPQHSENMLKLISHKASMIWIEMGSPTGKQGKDVQEQNWLKAEKLVRDEVAERAYKRWVDLKKPEGRDAENWEYAARSLVHDWGLDKPPAPARP